MFTALSAEVKELATRSLWPAAAGLLGMWIASRERAASALAGINAGVVGLFAAALYDLVWTNG